MTQELGPIPLARLHFRQGGGQEDNPYPKGSKDREVYALEMGRQQQEEFTRELESMNHE